MAVHPTSRKTVRRFLSPLANRSFGRICDWIDRLAQTREPSQHWVSMESLEQRFLMAAQVPADYVQINPSTISVQSQSSTPTQTGITLESGRNYYFVASGTHVLASDGREADAQYYEKTPDDWVAGSGPHLHVTGVSSWGAYDSGHEYGAQAAGNGSELAPWISDSDYGDNSGSLSLDVYEQATLESLTVTDIRDGQKQAVNPSEDELIVPLSPVGDATIDLDAAASLSGISDSQIVWAVFDGGGGVIDSGNLGSGQPTIQLFGEGEFTVEVGIDLDGDGDFDTDESQLTTTVYTVDIDDWTVTDQADPGNQAINPDDDVLEIYSPPGPDEGDVGFSYTAAPPTAFPEEWVVWKFTGENADGDSEEQRGAFPMATAQMQPSTEDLLDDVAYYQASVGLDLNGNGELDDDEEYWTTTVVFIDPDNPTPPLPVTDSVGLSSHHRVDIHGVPLPDPSPTGDGEQDRVPNMAQLDAFSLLPSFGTTDVAVPMPGGELTLEFRRTLSAGSKTENPESPDSVYYNWPVETIMGRGWTPNTASRLIQTFNPDPEPGHAHHRITVYDEVGNAASFALMQGQWVPDVAHTFSAEALRGTVRPRTDGKDGFVYRKSYGTELYFESFSQNTHKRGDSDSAPTETYFRLEKIVDRNGNTLEYEYAAPNLGGRNQATLVSKILDPSKTDRYIAFGYEVINQFNGEARLTSVEDPVGRVHEYEYYEPGEGIPDWKVGQLKSVVKPEVAGADGSVAAPQVDFDYTHEIAQRISVDSLIFDIDNINITETEWWLPASITALGAADDPGRHVTSFAYTMASMPTVIENWGGMPRSVWENRPILQTVTTSDGTVNLELVNDTQDPDDLSHTQRTTRITDTRGITTTYDFAGDTIEWSNDLGFSIYIDEVTRQTEVDAALPGSKPVPLIGGGSGGSTPANYTVIYDYSDDVFSNLESVTDLNGNVVKFEYDSGDQNDPYNAAVYAGITGTHYQVFGQPSRSVLADNDPNLQVQTLYRYDTLFNKLVRQTDAEGVVSSYTLDTRGNRTHVIEADGTDVEATTVYDYDSTGFVTRITDPDLRVTEFIPNDYGHLKYTIVKGNVSADEDLTPLDVNDGFYVTDLGANAEKWLTTRRIAGVMDLTATEYDPTGDQTNYTYDTWYRQITATPPAVEDPTSPSQTTTSTATTTYDFNSNVVKQVDHNGNTTVTFYDVFNRPTVTVLDLDGDGDFGAAVGTRVNDGLAFTPDTSGGTSGGDIATRRNYDPVGLVAEEKDPNGNVTRYEYDELLRQTLVTEAFDTPLARTTQSFYGPNSGSGAFTLGGFNPTRVINPRGYATDTTYDSAYRAVQVVRRNETGSALDNLDHDALPGAGEPATLTEYNKVHNPIKVTVLNENLGGSNADRISYTYYDHRHRPTVSVVDMDAGTAGVTPGSFVDNAQTFAGDAGDLISRTRYDLAGNVTKTIDAEGRVTETLYDGASRVTQVKLPTVAIHNPVTDTITTDEPTTTTVYDADGNVALVTDPNGNQSATYYDARNRPTVTVLDLDGDSNFGTAPGTVVSHPDGFTADTSGGGGDVVNKIGYDLSGNVLYTIDPRNNRTDTTYDRANRVTQVEGPEVPDAETPGSPLTRPTTTTTYDKNSNVLTVTDPRGIVTQTTYDALNRPTTVTANALASGGDADRVTTESQYDANDNVTARILYNRVNNVDRPQVTTYTYDAYDRQTSETLPDIGDNQPRVTVTVYNRAGQALRVTDPKGQKHESTYDRAGRLVESNHIRTDSSVEETRTFDYDKVGNLLEATDNSGGGTSTYEYDALNRVISESRDNTSWGSTSGGTVQSFFDANGNRTKVVYPNEAGTPGSGRILINRYDRRNLLTQVNDSVGNQVTTYAYDLAGNRTLQLLPNGVETNSTFDALNRVETMTTQNDYAYTVYDAAYAYDLVGNRRSIEETTGRVSNAPTTRNLTYDYDDLYRLTQESWSGTPGSTYDYTYDKAGNRLTKSINGALATEYFYDDLNRLTEDFTSGGFETSRGYDYDLNGNRIRTSNSGGESDPPDLNYIYDTNNRLIEATGDDDGTNPSTIFEAEYDYRTRRLSKTEYDSQGTPTTTYFRYDGGTSFQELDDVGNIKVEFVRGGSGAGMGGGIGSILYSDRTMASGGGPVEFFTYNAVGHTVATTDDGGDVVSANLYDAFGNVVSSSGTSDNNRLANTKERDASLGLDNHGFRYYDPSTGRYLTRDPIGYADGMNPYLSVHNNPINHIDPLGLETKTPLSDAEIQEMRRNEEQRNNAVLEWNAAVAEARYEGRTPPRVVEPASVDLQTVSTIYDAVPVVGTLKGGIEVVTGRDPLTGQQLSTTQRVVGGLLTVASVIPFGKLIGKGISSGMARVASWFGRNADEAAETAEGIVKQVDNVAPPEGHVNLPDGSFSITDWSDYPTGIPRPQGPFRLLSGEEYNAARKQANAVNRELRSSNPEAYAGTEIHEIKPVKWNGSPTDLDNKIPVETTKHRKEVTPWWNERQREIEPHVSGSGG